MKHCCEDDHMIEPDPTDIQGRRSLKIVLLMQVVMCIITWVSGWISHSTVVLADGVDFLSHVFLLTLSLYATGHGVRWIGRASLIKGITMSGIGLSVLIDAIRAIHSDPAPAAHTLGMIGILGIATNLATFSLLGKIRHNDVNMHSSWLCSRNDLLTHFGILVTSVLVALTHSRWPDTIVGAGLSLLILNSGIHVIQRSIHLLRSDTQKLDTRATEAL